MLKLEQMLSWHTLNEHSQQLKNKRTSDLFLEDVNRYDKLSFEVGELKLDFSKQRITEETLSLLINVAKEVDLKGKINKLFSGENINQTEQRPASHMRLRTTSAPDEEVEGTLNAMSNFVDDVAHGRLLNKKHEPISEVVALGIGGSALGPDLITNALSNLNTGAVKIHYVSNVDEDTLTTLTTKVAWDRAICLISSKSFSTIETITNARAVRKIFESSIGAEQAADRLYAITANIDKAIEFGIKSKNTFKLWDWVGGRYSLWSAVGLPIALSIGMKAFLELLQGANDMDEHFSSTDFENNIPVLMGLIGIWNINILGSDTLAVLPYADSLEKLPAYLQQLEMESNGKSSRFGLGKVNYQTAPVLWGGVGCDGQHAYMQMLHQGPMDIPVDFILPMSLSTEFKEQRNIRVASALAQAKALMDGTNIQAEDEISLARKCPGNRPSTIISFDAITPRALGQLIALYEHKVFVQGAVWQIESFDQWGVELGKKLANNLLPCLEGATSEELDQSTMAHVRHMVELG